MQHFAIDRTNLPSSLLAYLIENVGTPVSGKDIHNQFSTTRKQDIDQTLTQLWSLGYVYPLSGYWYVTYLGMEVGDVTSKELYAPYRKRFEDVTPKTEKTRYAKWAELIEDYYQHFKKSHPEYNNLFVLLESRPHDKEELFKDVLRLFLQWQMKADYLYPGEKSYTYPEIFSSIDQAMSESIQKMIQYLSGYKEKAYTQDQYRKAQEAVQELMKDTSKFVQFYKSKPVGSCISREQFREFITSYLKTKKIPPVNVDQLFVAIEVAFTKLLSDQDTIYYETEKPSIIAVRLKQVLSRLKEKANTILNTFISSPVKANLISIASTALSGGEFIQANFESANFAGFTITNSDFSSPDSRTPTNFKSSKWAGARIINNNFTNADFSFADLTAKEFEQNNIHNANFSDAGFAKTFDIGANDGTPRNLSFRDASIDKEFVTQVLNEPPFSSNAIPIDDTDTPAARNIIKALHGILSQRPPLESSKSSPSLLKFSALTEEEITQLRTWLEVPSEGPSFTKDIYPWLVEKNKSKELSEAGFSTKDINYFFGKAKEGQKPKEKIVDPDILKIQSFIDTYQGASNIPAQALFEFLPNRSSKLGQWLVLYGNTLTFRELVTIYHTLVVTIRQFHANPYVSPQRAYQAVPYSSRFYNLGSLGVEGKGSQFGLGILPNYGLMSPRISQMTDTSLIEGGSHFSQAFAFSRITPYTYTIVDVASKRPNILKVWYISEMQTDTYQKAGQREKIFKKYGEDAVTEFRDYYKHWSENLLNAILAAAGRVGVSEVWMPTHDDVEKKTEQTLGEGNAPNWYNAYDRAAKVFGGQLKNVGVTVNLDPASQYKRTSNTFYVIPISQKQKESSLQLLSLQLTKTGEYDWDYIREMLGHHIKWVISNNRSKFPDVEKYVADDMLAQFAYKTFFHEYHIPTIQTQDREFMSEVKRIFEEEFGYELYPPPYIDWLYWMQKAWDDVRFFIKNQKKISPDLGVSDQELARDWFKLWVSEQVPEDIKYSHWYEDLFVQTVRHMLQDKGLGDILSTEYILPQSPEEKKDLILNPPDKDEGEEVLEGPPGELLPGKEKEEPSLQFKSPSREELENIQQEQIDKYLDRLQEAISKGDTEKADKLRNELKRLTSESSLKLGWKILEPKVGDTVKVIAPREKLVEINFKKDAELFGEVGRIEEILNTEEDFMYTTSKRGLYKGEITVYTLNLRYILHFPFSHWQEFFEIVEEEDKESSLKLGWRVRNPEDPPLFSRDEFYWGGSGKYQEEYDRMWEKLVPPEGSAGTDAGNLLREISKVYYDLYNNGFGNGPFSLDTVKKYNQQIKSKMSFSEDYYRFMSLFRSTGYGEEIVGNGPVAQEIQPYLEEMVHAIILVAKELDEKEVQSSLKLENK